MFLLFFENGEVDVVGFLMLQGFLAAKFVVGLKQFDTLVGGLVHICFLLYEVLIAIW